MNFSFFKAQPPASKKVKGKAEIDRQFRYWRIRMMIGAFIGYAVYYFVRKNLSAATPALIKDLGYTKTDIGMVWSVLYLTYGVSKFAMGVAADRSNPRYFMPLGLLLSALCNVFFGMSSSLYVLALFWGLNGWVQGMGAPSCTRVLTQWYSAGERGTWWGVWNAAHQVGGAVILILGGWLTQTYGWRSAFMIPAALAVLGALFLVNCLRDTPESLGLPSVEEWRDDHVHPENEKRISGKHPVKHILFKQVLNNPALWALAVGNFFVYLVRYGAMDWAPTFLVEVKQSTIASAAMKTAGFELIGIVGALVAGWLSDKVFKGNRGPINVLYMVVLALAVLGFWKIPAGHPYWDAALLSAVGFLVYGPQMLVGVSATDLVSKSAAATANGFTGLTGYMGSIASGAGTGWVVDHYGWNGGFLFFVAAALIGAVCFVPTIKRTR